MIVFKMQNYSDNGDKSEHDSNISDNDNDDKKQ